MEEDCPFVFTIAEEEQENVRSFLREHKHEGRDFGAIGGHISYTFTSTSIGPIATIKCGACNERRDVSGNL